MSGRYEDSLGIIVMDNIKEFGEKVNEQIMEKRQTSDSFLIRVKTPRFNNGDSKGVIIDSVRDKDIYILSDVGNHSMTYKMFGHENHMSPDEHFQDIKRVISALRAQPDRITVFMPMLYQSRQHRRNKRESLDCALALQELHNLGVNVVSTIDVHDPNIQNAVPANMSFENFFASTSILTDFIKEEDFNPDDVIFISPDNGAMERTTYYANMFGADVGLLYKRRDLSQVVDGKNPVVAHEYLGRDIDGKTVIIVDDIIDSGGSMLDVIDKLKERGANKVYAIATFSLFSKGLDAFYEAYNNKHLNKIYSTNLTYTDSDLIKAPWYRQVDCTGYVSDIIDTLNKSGSITELKNGKQLILKMLDDKRKGKL